MCIQEVCFGATPFEPCFKCPSSTSQLNTIYCTFIFRTRRRISTVNSEILQGWVSLDHQKIRSLGQYAQENKISGLYKRKQESRQEMGGTFLMQTSRG